MRQGLSKDLIARVLGGAPKYTISDLENKYPSRNLPDGAIVSRFAPSPTGYMHIGGLYQALLDWKLAQQTGGVFMLRIEDTDTKREVADATKIIQDSLAAFGLPYDNMPEYGPYNQSQRKDVYHSIVAELLARGNAYPCFLTASEMNDIRDGQKAAGLPTGIYGEWARWRDADESEIIARLDAGEIPSVRLYSRGDASGRIFCKDAVRGSISFPENNEDIILIKSNDGLPTYHFAMLCDDHFMRTTHIVRGEEWLPSLPLHYQLFDMMGWTPPAFIHTSTIDKIDAETGKQRKISKRHDPEANVAYFLSDGWPIEAVKNYLFNIMASGFEEEKNKKPDTTIDSYELRLKKIPTSGALFDWKKLEWWAREFIATLSVDELTARVVDWVHEYGDKSAKRFVASAIDISYLKNILSIERDPSVPGTYAAGSKRVRKDFITWRQTMDEIAYFWDDEFAKCFVASANTEVLNKFLTTFDINDNKDVWWNKIVAIANELGVKNGEVAMALRVAITGRTNTPDLYSIMQVMGNNRVRERLNG